MTMGSVPCEVCILAPCRAGAICKIFTRVTVDARTGTRLAEQRFQSLHPGLVNRRNRGLAPLLHPGALGRYEIYQRHTRREIPVVILEPCPRSTPAT